MARSVPRESILESGILSALAASQPRALRVFSRNLDIVWEDPQPHGNLRLLFRDNSGRAVSIPPPGEEFDRWPVNRAWTEKEIVEQDYLLANQGRVRVRAWKLPRDGSYGCLVAEEIEALPPTTGAQVAVQDLDAELRDLIQRIPHFVASESTGNLLSIRLANPHLQQCYEIKGCPHETCPAREANATLRCWEIDGTFCPTISSAHDRLNKFFHCSQCQVFLAACPDHLTRVAENINWLLTLFELKYYEALQAQQQVQQAGTMAVIGELALGIAHEIKNPLSIIMSRLDCLRLEMDTLTPEEALDDLEVMRAHLQRVRKILEDLMTLAHPAPPQRQMVNLNELALKTLAMVRKTMEKERIDLKTEFHNPLPAIPADPLQVQQVLLNLILNAREAISDGGEIKISTVPAEDGNGVVLTVEDDGPGITPADQPRVFSMFYTTKGSHGGNGLGLSVCQRIVSRHGGTISLSSVLGEGCAFQVWFPKEDHP